MENASLLADGLSVLVVDDDEFSRDLLAEMLVDQGVTEVHTAINGRDALRTLSCLPQMPDMMICDVFMPDMDGIEFMAELGKQRYQGGVMLLTGVDVEMLSLAQELARADGLKLLGSFTNPLHRDTLAAVLRLVN